MEHLDDILFEAPGVTLFSAQKSTIRCGSHVVHLGATELLVGVKAATKEEMEGASIELASDFDAGSIESTHGNKDVTILADLSDRDVLRRQVESRTDGNLSAIQKVHFQLFGIFRHATQHSCLQVRECGKLVRSSGQRGEHLEEAIKHANALIARRNIGVTDEGVHEKDVPLLNLILDVCTRWNSTFYMLERALDLRKAS